MRALLFIPQEKRHRKKDVILTCQPLRFGVLSSGSRQRNLVGRLPNLKNARNIKVPLMQALLRRQREILSVLVYRQSFFSASRFIPCLFRDVFHVFQRAPRGSTIAANSIPALNTHSSIAISVLKYPRDTRALSEHETIKPT